jgi:hypothetical protein
MRRMVALAALLLLLCESGLGHTQPAPRLPSAWVAIKFQTPGNIPIGTLPNVTAELRSARDNGTSFKQRYSSEDSARWISAALSSGRVQFRNVPTGIPLVFQMSYTSPTGAKGSYSGTYTFRYPDLSAAQRVKARRMTASRLRDT